MNQSSKSLARVDRVEAYRASNGFMIMVSGQASGSMRDIRLERVSDSEIHAHDVPSISNAEVTDVGQIVLGTAMWVPRLGIFVFEGALPGMLKFVSAEGEKELEISDPMKFF